MFSAMVWLIYKDVMMKGVQYQYFTAWGAYSTMVFFGLQLIISLQKVSEQEQFYRCSDRRALVEDMLKKRDFWYLNSFTAWLYQWCLISELTIACCFWAWLWVFGTDVSKLTGE